MDFKDYINNDVYLNLLHKRGRIFWNIISLQWIFYIVLTIKYETSKMSSNTLFFAYIKKCKSGIERFSPKVWTFRNFINILLIIN